LVVEGHFGLSPFVEIQRLSNGFPFAGLAPLVICRFPGQDIISFFLTPFFLQSCGLEGIIFLDAAMHCRFFAFPPQRD